MRMYRKGAMDPFRHDLKTLATWIRARAPEAWSRRGTKGRKMTIHQIWDRLQSKQRSSHARDLIRLGVHLLQMLRQVACDCDPVRGHWEKCARLGAMKQQFYLGETYGIYYHTDVDAPIPQKVKELHSHEVHEADPDDPDVLTFTQAG